MRCLLGRRVLTALLGLVLLLPSPNVASAADGDWVVQSGDVRITCPLTVGGTFEAKTTALTGEFTPGGAQTETGKGRFVVDLKTLETGITLRDSHLRSTYLEVEKGEEYSKAVLSDIRITGAEAAGLNGKGKFSGTLRLHGVERPVGGSVEIRRMAQTTRVRASFPVSITQFGIPTPRYLGVGVRDEVTVQVTFDSTTGESTR